MSEWIDLFNGVDLTGWEDFKNPHLWSARDGMIVGVSEVKKMSNLSTVEQYGDFELTFEYNHDARVNSGCFLRVSDLKDEVHTGLEIQILDSTDGEDSPAVHDCGGLYDMVAPAVNAAKPAGEWNTYNIKLVGPSLQVDLNGQRTLDVNLDDFTTVGVNPDGSKNKFKYAWATMPRKGHIGLQTHSSMDSTSGCEIRFRNIRLRSL